jgi:2'-5' RNA ligase
MPRLFTALELPERVRTRLGLIRSPLAGARWVEPDNFHITLRFAGDIDNRTADEFAGFLDDIALEPFDIRISGLGAFGGRTPRVIWAGVEGDQLDVLQRAHERAARSAGLEPDPQTYRPHVTLARLRGTRPEAVARFLGSRGALMSEPFRVERFVLFSSRPGSGGGPYVHEQLFPLGQGYDFGAGDVGG